MQENYKDVVVKVGNLVGTSKKLKIDKMAEFKHSGFLF